MKLSPSHQIVVHGSKHIAALTVCLAFLLAPSARAVVGYTANANSTFLNVYFNDGTGSSSAYGTSISPYTPLRTITSSSTGVGMPLTDYSPTSWLQTGTTFPLGPQSANWSDLWLSIGNALAVVQYDQGTFFMGSNTVSSTYISPYGTSLLLENFLSTGTAELRLDWTTTYTYNGPAIWASGTYNVGEQITDANGNAELCVQGGTTGGTEPGSWPLNPASLTTTPDGGVGGVTWMIIPTYAPTEFMLTASASVVNFFAVAGQETFTVTDPTTATSTTATLQIPWGGDFSSGYSSLPPGLSGNIDSGVIGVFGSKTPGTYTGIGVATVPSGTLPMPIQDGDTLTVSGYIDVFVDPANFQIEIEPVPQRPLGITMSGGKPVVYFPMITPTNGLLQTTTNLLTGPWVPVTNVVPVSVTEDGGLYGGLMITNAAKSAFFRLH